MDLVGEMDFTEKFTDEPFTGKVVGFEKGI